MNALDILMYGHRTLLDSIADLWWTQHQVQRLGAGKDPDPTYGPRRAVLHALKRDGRNILRRRRGI